MSSKLPSTVPNCMSLLEVCVVLIGIHSCKDLLPTESSGILLPLEKRVGGSQSSVPWGKDTFRAEYVLDLQIVVL